MPFLDRRGDLSLPPVVCKEGPPVLSFVPFRKSDFFTISALSLPSRTGEQLSVGELAMKSSPRCFFCRAARPVAGTPDFSPYEFPCRGSTPPAQSARNLKTGRHYSTNSIEVAYLRRTIAQGFPDPVPPPPWLMSQFQIPIPPRPPSV